MTNLYNFMDGMDGLAGGMAVFGFGALAVFGILGGAWGYGLLNAVVAAPPPAFCCTTCRAPASSSAISAPRCSASGPRADPVRRRRRAVSALGGLLVFSPFIVDATWTLLRRAARGEKIWRAHREHHYQRLVLAGWPTAHPASGLCPDGGGGGDRHRRTRTAGAEQWLLLAGWAGIYALIHLRVELAERARSAAPNAG
jgi:hypothetical protein